MIPQQLDILYDEMVPSYEIQQIITLRKWFHSK